MILTDTAFWLALANPRDHHHGRAAAWLDAIDEPLITTWTVVTETSYLLLHRLGPESHIKFLESAAAGGFEVLTLPVEALQRVAELMRKNRDLPMDLADASLVLAAEQLGHGRILSTDERVFQAYRWKPRKPFRNLLLEDPESYG